MRFGKVEVFILASIIKGTLLSVYCLNGQTEVQNQTLSFGGFVRGGAYYDLNRQNDKPLFSSGFSDLALKLEARQEDKMRAFSDIRLRYGSEFNNSVNSITIREAFTEVYFPFFRFSIGQQIIKWAKTDFTTTNSKLNPQNFITRSPDREDMDLGNIIASLSWYPSPIFDFQAVYIPFYRPSVLLVDQVPIPEGVEIKSLKSLVTDKNYSGYGFKGSIHIRGADLGVTWFDGYDPMPGIKLDEFSLDMSGPVPVASTKLSVTPYKIRSAGIFFEAVTGEICTRGEVALSDPYADYRENEYVPAPEVKWVGGFDYTPGDWRIVFEYSGKYITRFTRPDTEPLIGTEPDYTQLLQLISTPGFDIKEYVRKQTEAFNRLYNYQLEKSYHSAGLRLEKEIAYGKYVTSLSGLYNFTAHELLLIPEIKFKPYDAITITAGAEIYSGRKGSLYKLVNDFMESIYAGIRIDF
ncbi:MAG TPA: hypothetical protein PLT59_01895 [Bacteroidales bacterium]|nr:hypothetical protein [Bacteroidales bacterium]